MEQPSLQAILSIVKNSLAREFKNLQPDDIFLKIAQGAALSEDYKIAARLGLGLEDPTQIVMLAPFDMSGHRVVAYADNGSIEYASSDNARHAQRTIGLTTNAASFDALINIKNSGSLTEPSWSWNVELPIYLGKNGYLTQIEPSIENGDAFLLVIAVPKNSTSLILQRGEPFFLA